MEHYRNQQRNGVDNLQPAQHPDRHYGECRQSEDTHDDDDEEGCLHLSLGVSGLGLGCVDLIFG